MTALTAAHSLLPATPLPALGPEWLDPAYIINSFVSWVGPWAVLGVALVVFAETGLLVGFFLPGDSLLFTLGMFVGAGTVAVIGNQTGYYIGHRAGPSIFNRPDSRLFKKEHVERTGAFFEKHGGKAVTLAQFVPIVRTFTPVMAGVGRMSHRHFTIFNIIGATFWAFLITCLGFFLGSVTWIQKNIDSMILAIVFVSVLPMIIAWAQAKIKARKDGVSETA